MSPEGIDPQEAVYGDNHRPKKNLVKPRLHLGNIMGPEGNAFVILGRAQTVAREKKMTNWEEIQREATSGDYAHLLQVIEKHFKVEYN